MKYSCEHTVLYAVSWFTRDKERGQEVEVSFRTVKASSHDTSL